jgi:hypothetical protein
MCEGQSVTRTLAVEQLGFRAETTLAEGLGITLDALNAAAESEPRP